MTSKQLKDSFYRPELPPEPPKEKTEEDFDEEEFNSGHPISGIRAVNLLSRS